MQRNLASSTRRAVHTMGKIRIDARGIRSVLSTTQPIIVTSEDTLERKYYQCAQAWAYFLGFTCLSLAHTRNDYCEKPYLSKIRTKFNAKRLETCSNTCIE